jgi:hypothetical protein
MPSKNKDNNNMLVDKEGRLGSTIHADIDESVEPDRRLFLRGGNRVKGCPAGMADALPEVPVWSGTGVIYRVAERRGRSLRRPAEIS